jgi:hypothetical protein
MDHGVARGHIDLARKLEALPEVADAYGRGEISQRHAQVVAHAYTPERAADIARVESELVDVARDHTPKELGGVVRYLTDAIDGDGGTTADEADFDNRACYMSFTLGGVLNIQANCDRLTGEAIMTAVNAEMARDLQAHDPRRSPQRRMDALFHLCRLALDRGELGETHHIQPHISTVIDIDELPGTTPERVARVRTELRRNELSAAMLELLTCDCDLSRVIMAGKSEILDVGRATRNPTAAQWKALVVRDRHCQAPGCDRPPDHCQAHHIVHWTRGGPTNLDNLQLLCWNHHRQQHACDAQARAALPRGLLDP